MTWGANLSGARALAGAGAGHYLEQQLHPPARDTLPAEAQARIDAMTISRRPIAELAAELEQTRKNSDAIPGVEEKKAAQQAYQQDLNRLGREATERMLLRALYSPHQLREQMAWFWMNHFSVHLYKANLRALVGDYEERAIRPHALGRFRDLLAGTAHHAAMLRYLDNEQNSAGRINENYARELMELHTLGVGGGYTQRDVQELARILTGFGVNAGPDATNVRPALRSQYVHRDLFEFNPNRHDYGDKVFLGQTIHGRGAAELDEALDLLSRHPSTARFVSRKLAAFLLSDDPPAGVVERMAGTFVSSGGDIAATLGTLFATNEFARSLGGKFKDPVHYVVSAVRLAYDDKVILNAGPMINWLNRMGETPYGRPTPDGYPLTRSEWASAGQLATRFEVARALGYGNAGLFKGEGPNAAERAAFPQLNNALYYGSIEQSLGKPTRDALERATSPQEWNLLLLASPEFMHR
jgi:uncharacterized protein (DUF1800 family)